MLFKLVIIFCILAFLYLTYNKNGYNCEKVEPNLPDGWRLPYDD